MYLRPTVCHQKWGAGDEGDGSQLEDFLFGEARDALPLLQHLTLAVAGDDPGGGEGQREQHTQAERQTE